MSIKKAYVGIMSLLAANMDATVESIYDQVEALASAKAGGGAGATSFHKNEDGDVVALRCGYFGLWFLASEVEFGKKASSASGYNTMCKVGMSAWTKAQSNFKKAKEQLLDDVAAGTVAPGDIAAVTAELEETRLTPIELPEGMVGATTLEELLG